MRVRIHHTTQYSYDHPIRSAIQLLRMTPRSTDSQHVVKWRVETDVESRLKPGEDTLGNITHTLFVEKPIERLRLSVVGEVETQNTGGVLRGAVERFAPGVFLRETPLTATNAEMRAYAQDVVSGGGDDRVAQMHGLMGALHRDIAFSTATTDVATPAIDAFQQRSGVCQDISHIFIGMARWLGAPARYVSGHLMRQDGIIEQDAAHAWVEIYLDHLGWVGFDATNGICPTDAYVRVAVALDYLGAAPVRGHRQGGGRESLEVILSVASDPDYHNQ